MNDLRQLKQEKLLRLYQRDPVLYTRQHLKQYVTSDAAKAMRAVVQYKKVNWRACHGVSKTHTAACLVNWSFDCFPIGLTLTTAPTGRQVKKFWKEVRHLRPDTSDMAEKAPLIEDNEKHYAEGFTANDAEAFQGDHSVRIFILFDEAVGIAGEFFEAADGMMTSEESYHLNIYNPTDPTSHIYGLEKDYHVIQTSSLDHENIKLQLAGQKPVIAAGVTLYWLEDKIARWCEPVKEPDPKKNDFEWPPDSGVWYRPGPLFESRCLGLWPSQSIDSVWSETAWNNCLVEQDVDMSKPLEIGCDVARFGDDDTAIHVRRGNCSLHHEQHNGWPTPRTAGKLKELAKLYSAEGEDPCEVAIKIDDTGVGGGVVDLADGYNFIGVISVSVAADDEYPNIRSELWFDTAERAGAGNLDLTRLSESDQEAVGKQCKQVRWDMNAQGQRVVEKKEKTKKRLKKSPDDADGFNLAYYIPPDKRVTFYTRGKRSR